MSTTTAVLKPNVISGVKAGAVAGLAGGVVFGMMMAMMGMLPMVGMLIRQDSAIVGLVRSHLCRSAKSFNCLAWQAWSQPSPAGSTPAQHQNPTHEP
ncbi:MAG: hypothetical protein HZC38_16065 [Chloroflexi bacterium]|nr:hypothetical protein [Chloroflexota bacterium]